MSLSITIKGVKLNQSQLDTIVPVLNLRLQGKVSKKDFESQCIGAMAKAGCPLNEAIGNDPH